MTSHCDAALGPAPHRTSKECHLSNPSVDEGGALGFYWQFISN